MTGLKPGSLTKEPMVLKTASQIERKIYSNKHAIEREKVSNHFHLKNIENRKINLKLAEGRR